MPAGGKRSLFDGTPNGALRFVIVCAVAETALPCKQIDIVEGFLKTGTRLPETDFPYSRSIDKNSSGGSDKKLPGRGRVTPLCIEGANLAGRKNFAADPDPEGPMRQ